LFCLVSLPLACLDLHEPNKTILTHAKGVAKSTSFAIFFVAKPKRKDVKTNSKQTRGSETKQNKVSLL
jgi:hypothetical protein